MKFFKDSSIPIRGSIREAFVREWDRLARPGSQWSSSERIGIAARARDAREGAHGDVGTALGAADGIVRLLGATPGLVRRRDVDEAILSIGEAAYVELVGVVARGSAVDGFHRAIGLSLPAYPDPVPGEPSGDLGTAATPGPAWVAMAGGSSIVGALSLVPAESAAQEDLHGPLYLTYAEMDDLELQRGLTRSQMELVAARTSAINECFY